MTRSSTSLLRRAKRLHQQRHLSTSHCPFLDGPDWEILYTTCREALAAYPDVLADFLAGVEQLKRERPKEDWKARSMFSHAIMQHHEARYAVADALYALEEAQKHRDASG